VYDTNGGAGYTAIDPTQYSNNGVLTAVPGGGANRQYSIQRVFYFPNSVAKAIVVYYGNAVYTTQTDATSNIPYEPFVEAPNTAANAIYLGAIIVRNNADFTVSDSYNIQPGGLFRQVGGSGGGGSVVTQTLAGLSDVAISAPTNGQALVYDTTAAKWQNKSSISASISGNATTATTAATASSADDFTVRGTLTAQTIVAQTITSSTDYVSGSTIFGNSLSNTHQFTGSVSMIGSLAVKGPITNSSGSFTLFSSQSAQAASIDIKNFNGTSVIQLNNNGSSVFNDGMSVPYISTAASSLITPSNWMFGPNFVIGASAKVHISGSNAALFRIDSPTFNNILFVTSSGNVGIGTNTPSARLDISGSGNTSATVALNVQNGDATSLLRVRNDAYIEIPSNAIIGQSNNSRFWRLGDMYFQGFASVIWATWNTSAYAEFARITGNKTNRGLVIGATDNNNSAILQADSINQGFLLPRMTEAQRTAISSPAQGLLVYDTGSATEGLWLYNSGSTPGWQEVLTNSGSQSISGSITANSITVTGTLTAQTIVAQTITSSTDFVSGSTIFGNILSNTHQFTGSVSITGSLTLPYLSTGSVLFAGATDNITEDNANFFWDDTNNRLGIGTNTPARQLEIFNGIGGEQILARFRCFNAAANAGIEFLNSTNTNAQIVGLASTNGLSFRYGTTEGARLTGAGNLHIGTFASDTGERLQVSGSSRFAGNMVITGSANITQALTASVALISGSGTQRLVVVGSGSAQPLFTVQGSQGELFSIVDSLSGSLFSVNDQSGLPIMEVFSDNTILMGNYLDPMLLTTTRTGSAAGINTLYTLPTSSYDAVYIDYAIRSGSNARAGNFMAMWSGTSVNFTDNSITEFGTTSGFIFGAHVSGSNMVVTGSSPTAGWTVKTIVKAI